MSEFEFRIGTPSTSFRGASNRGAPRFTLVPRFPDHTVPRFAWRRALAGCVLVAVLIGANACALTFDARTLGARTTLAARATEQPQGEEFRVTRSAVFLLWGLAAASRPSLERVLAAQVTGEAEIANLRVRVRSRFGDLLVTVLTAGLVVPRSVTYEGVIVRPAAQ